MKPDILSKNHGTDKCDLRDTPTLINNNGPGNPAGAD